MPTNEDRKEVVKALRDLCDGCETVSDYDLAKALCLVAVSRNAYSSDSVLRIADLIEPKPERKAKSKPFPVEKDTGYFDTTKCECGYLNDVSATYCGQCGCVIEVVHYAN